MSPQGNILGYLAPITKNENAAKPNSAQLRLRDCKKVVILGKPASQFDVDDILQLKRQLDDQTATVPQMLDMLRTLSCCHVDRNTLAQTAIGATVRRLRQHGQQEVATLAARLVDKWRAMVLQQAPA